MGETTAIAWTTHTFNPWWGCTAVSPACKFCYAEAFDKRVGGAHWGPGVPRREFGDKHWNEPLRWDRIAQKAGARARVFCASMADVFDSEVPPEWRRRLWDLIAQTAHLDWLLLTKRPANIAKMLPADWSESGWPNVWLGTTVEDQKHAAIRLPALLEVPARVHFISYEPALGPLDLEHVVLFQGDGKNTPSAVLNALTGNVAGPDDQFAPLDWVIVGGESGPHARPFELAWAESVQRQCATHARSFFFKQLGSVITGKATDHGYQPERWPADLRVQQFPESR